MKKTILFLLVMCFLIGTFLNGQNRLPVHAVHGPSHSPEHTNAVIIFPLYDSIYQWTFDTTAKAWDVSSKEIRLEYNAGYRITSDLVQNWSGSQWVNYTVDTFSYNAINLDTADIDKAWTGSAWENNYKYTYTYNAIDSITTETVQILNGSGWRNYQKYSYTYDAHNNKTNLLAQQWNGSNWMFSYNYAYTYNSNNLKIMEVDSTAASTERWLYSYNISNLLVNDSSQYRSGSGWATDFNYIYTYNASNLDTSEVIQQWTGSAWAGYEKYTYTYDAGNNMIGEIYYIWTGNAIEKFQQFAYTYDANNFMLSEEEKQFFDAGTRVIIGDSTYWYFHKISGVSEITDENNLRIYPNPGKGIFTVSLSHPELGSGSQTIIEVYNMMGQKVNVTTLNQPTGRDYKLDVSNQPDGVYFLLLKSERGEWKGKVVVQR